MRKTRKPFQIIQKNTHADPKGITTRTYKDNPALNNLLIGWEKTSIGKEKKRTIKSKDKTNIFQLL